MLEDHNNIEWNRKRAKAIVDHFGYKFFFGKRILDLGAGHGDIAEVFARLGAEINCVDARQENLDFIAKNYPHMRTQKVDLDNDFPFAFDQYDIILSLGLLCHLKNYDKHIKDICGVAEHIVLETEVFDSDETDVRVPIYEEKLINDLSFHGVGSIVSASNIQNKISELGATFQRKDKDVINSGIYTYDWKETNGGRRIGNRRIWFIKSDKFIQLKLENQTRVELAEREAAWRPTPQEPAMAKDHPNYVPRTLPPLPPRNIPYIQSSNYSPKIRLFYNYYEDKNATRKKETDLCLNKNINNLYYDTIIVESENNPTFNFMFEKINKLVGDDDISIICNSDIFFDETILLASNIGAKEVYALSRWDWNENGSSKLFDRSDSQDVWIVRGKVENVFGDFTLGAKGCDNRISYEFNQAGYKITNPSKSIKSYHVHNSVVRNYSDIDIVPPPYLKVEPITLLSHIFALTSICPRPDQFKIQKECIQSWIESGCEVIAFQSPKELNILAPSEWPGVHFIEAQPSNTYASYIPISRMIRWAESQNGYALLINSDCRLSANKATMSALTEISNKGLVYLVRHDIDDKGITTKQQYGIDAFIFPTQFGKLIPESDIFCMGKPWWDTVLPAIMLGANKKVFSPSFPILFHKTHQLRWDINADLRICHQEAVRVLRWNPRDSSNKLLHNCSGGGALHNKICANTENINYNPSWNNPPIEKQAVQKNNIFQSLAQWRHTRFKRLCSTHNRKG